MEGGQCANRCSEGDATTKKNPEQLLVELLNNFDGSRVDLEINRGLF